MSGFGFRRAEIESLETPWRAVDRALARWVLAHGGDELLAGVAAWASYVESLGDTVLWLPSHPSGARGMKPLSADQVDLLRTSPLVGDGSRLRPFVIDAAGRFYLWRNYRHECVVAARLRERLSIPAGALPPASSAELDTLFGTGSADTEQPQRAAVAALAGRALFVLTGGPGTGKTRTVLRMLTLLQRHADVPLRIALAAPTGKAAQRLLQSLRRGKQELRALLPDDWQPALAAVPDHEAQTLHRLLAYSPQQGRYLRSRADPITADVVVVDEASMVDLAMLRALLDAVPASASLILVGDADQLTSVAAGTVLQDLVALLESRHPESVVRLRHSFRAASGLLAINQAVRQGAADLLREAIAAAGEAARLRAYADEVALARLLQGWADALPLIDSIDHGCDQDRRPEQAAEHALFALRRTAERQLLCALREGATGVLAANRRIEQRLRSRWQLPPSQLWYSGRVVMISQNDYALNLFNGDIGVALADADGHLRVWFEAQSNAGEATARAFAPGMLPAHESAFAISIHKSQGSEYDHVAVLLPPDPAHRILSRQLLYTALSRARGSIELWCSRSSLEAALSQVAQRYGGLDGRLADTAAAMQRTVARADLGNVDGNSVSPLQRPDPTPEPDGD
jgi:exodeoxyribonuclease V alpha subunit